MEISAAIGKKQGLQWWSGGKEYGKDQVFVIQFARNN
jgi:hypothetical protein